MSRAITAPTAPQTQAPRGTKEQAPFGVLSRARAWDAVVSGLLLICFPAVMALVLVVLESVSPGGDFWAGVIGLTLGALVTWGLGIPVLIKGITRLRGGGTTYQPGRLERLVNRHTLPPAYKRYF